jgi:intein/homing endonuclease
MKFNESMVKYLAGIYDADGCMKIEHSQGSHIKISVYFSQSRQGEHLVRHLSEVFNVSLTVVDGSLDGGVGDSFRVCLTSKKKITQFGDRITKYMVVKGKPLKMLLSLKEEYKGGGVTQDQYQIIKDDFDTCRHVGGALKSRNFVSDAWAAGFIDGDGYYQIRSKGVKPTPSMSVSVRVFKEEKKLALHFLHEKYGGSLKPVKMRGGDGLRWHLGLGKGKAKGAIPFLKAMRKHSWVKKEKIQMMLNYLEAAQTEQRSTER